MYHSAVGDLGDQPPVDAEGKQPSLARAINLRDLWPPLYRSRFAILAIFAGVFALAATVTLLIKPLYRATATVEIRQEAQKVLGTEDNNDNAASTDIERYLTTQLEIIRSRSTALAVAQSLGLANNAHFLQASKLAPVEGVPSQSADERLRAIARTLQANVNVDLPRSSRIAEIQYSIGDPALSAQIANSFADNYIRLNLERRFDASRYSLQFLRGQLAASQRRLGESERQAIDYSRRSRLIDTGDTNDATAPKSLTTASLVQLNSALSDAVSRRLAAGEKWKAISGAPLLTAPEVLSNPVVQNLMGQQATLRAQYQQQLQTRREDYPSVLQLNAQIKELGDQIQAIAGRIRASLHEDYDAAASQEQAIRADLEKLKTATLDEQNRAVQLSILQRQANTNRQQLDALLTRYNEVNAQSGIQLNNLAVIDRAEAPTHPFWPNIPLNVALAFVLAALLSGGYVVGRENLFEMVRTPKDVTDRLHLASLGAVPQTEDLLRDIADSKTQAAEAFSTIRTSLSLSSGNGVPKSFMLTSTQAGEGKSSACYGLAVSLAKIGRRVIVVDADLRRPNVHRLFERKNVKGLSNILASEVSPEEVTHRDVLLGIDAITAGPIPPNPAELLAAGGLARLVAELETRYDHVLIDSAPVLGLADAPLVATAAKGIIFVVEAARTNVRGVASALNRLRPTGRPMLGVILSRFNPDEHGYSYDYKYSYNYAYANDGAGS